MFFNSPVKSTVKIIVNTVIRAVKDTIATPLLVTPGDGLFHISKTTELKNVANKVYEQVF